MAHSTIVFKHPTFGTIRSAPVGFSWTTALFGFWPALFRGDFKWAAIIFGITVAVSLVTLGVGAIVCWIIFGVIYNKMYIKELLAKGFLVDNMQSQFTLEQLQAQLETLLPSPPPIHLIFIWLSEVLRHEAFGVQTREPTDFQRHRGHRATQLI